MKNRQLFAYIALGTLILSGSMALAEDCVDGYTIRCSCTDLTYNVKTGTCSYVQTCISSSNGDSGSRTEQFAFPVSSADQCTCRTTRSVNKPGSCSIPIMGGGTAGGGMNGGF